MSAATRLRARADDDQVAVKLFRPAETGIDPPGTKKLNGSPRDPRENRQQQQREQQPGVRIPPRDSRLANWVPTFTYMMHPATMPSRLVTKKTEVRMGVRPMTRLMTKNGKIGISRSVNR